MNGRGRLDRVKRALVALALMLACATASGCGMRLFGKPGDPVDRPEVPRLTEVQRKVQEAKEQAALDAREPYWPYQLAETYLDADSTALAEAALRSSLHRDPGYAPALALLSRQYYRSGRHAEGAALLEAARVRATAQRGELPPDLVAGLALHYEALGRHDLAGALVGTGAGGDGKGSRSAQVYVALRGEKPEAATELARAALDDDPRSAVNQNNFGITRLRVGDPKGARGAFLRAIEIDPMLPGPYYNLAILERFYMFDEEAATRWLKEYRQRASEDPDGLFKSDAKPVAGKEGER